MSRSLVQGHKHFVTFAILYAVIIVTEKMLRCGEVLPERVSLLDLEKTQIKYLLKALQTRFFLIKKGLQ